MKNAVFWNVGTQFVTQETQYVFVTAPSPLMIYKIWGFRCNDYEDAVFYYVTPCGPCKNLRVGTQFRFLHQCDKSRRATNNVHSNYQTKPAKKQTKLPDSFYPRNGGDALLQNIDSNKSHTASHSRRWHSSQSPPWKPRTLLQFPNV
jgi:hypothetical protein